MLKIISVVGARPNFMKIAPIVKEIKKRKDIKNILVHTGQHYDKKMSKLFFEELGIPEPDINLNVGSDTHAKQTANIMIKFEQVLERYNPDLVLVVGDVNSTMACSITAVKMNIPVAHVEAGLRSFDKTMPEEINRIVTDSISSILFTTCEEANKNLKNEGIPEKKIFFTGNVMIDTLVENIKKAKRSDIMGNLKLKKRNFGLVTLHRPVNVDGKKELKGVMDAFRDLSKRIKIVFPVHPRSRKKMEEFGFLDAIKAMKNLILTEPLGYLDFLNLTMNSKMVFTDSGGIQEETSFLGIPCLTLRENTERPITISRGTNILVGTQKEKIIKEANKILGGTVKRGRKIQYWDGKAARRIVRILKNVNI